MTSNIHPALAGIAAQATVGYEALLSDVRRSGLEVLCFDIRTQLRIDVASADAASLGLDSYARQFAALSDAIDKLTWCVDDSAGPSVDVVLEGVR